LIAEIAVAAWVVDGRDVEVAGGVDVDAIGLIARRERECHDEERGRKHGANPSTWACGRAVSDVTRCASARGWSASAAKVRRSSRAIAASVNDDWARHHHVHGLVHGAEGDQIKHVLS
jgi:hypothetical protein